MEGVGVVNVGQVASFNLTSRDSSFQKDFSIFGITYRQFITFIIDKKKRGGERMVNLGLRL
jgi:hypothetical protein